MKTIVGLVGLLDHFLTGGLDQDYHQYLKHVENMIILSPKIYEQHRIGFNKIM